ncbi:MAG: hypothetical protein K2O24_08485 [Muribaculaceae bacterium]|nr:hypothetical protein [Muribaculaceae bacterium]
MKHYTQHIGRALLLTASLVAAAAGNAKVPTAYKTPQQREESKAKEYPELVTADQLVSNTKVIFVNSGAGVQVTNDSVMGLIGRFYYDQFRHAQDPAAPYFMFMSKDATMAMGIGGVIRMRGWFDWNGTVPANGFSPSAIPVPKDPATPRRMASTPAGTGLFFTILGRNTPIGNYMGYFEANFDGYNHIDFKLKKAYFTINDWTAGYATSTFADPAAQTPTIDGSGPNGKADRTNVLVRYLKTFSKDRWSVGGSLEFPSSGVTDEAEYTAKGTDWLPDLAALGQYQWDGGLSHVRLSGLMRFIPYRDLLTSTNHTVVGWGLQVSSKIKLLPPLTFYAAANIGRGHGSYTGDMGGSNVDLIADPDHPGQLYTPTIFGISTGLKYNFKPNLYSCLALSRLGFYAPKGGVPDDQYRYGLYGALNLFWDITPRFQVGAEYLIGERMNFSGEHASANRIDAFFQLSF